MSSTRWLQRKRLEFTFWCCSQESSGASREEDEEEVTFTAVNVVHLASHLVSPGCVKCELWSKYCYKNTQRHKVACAMQRFVKIRWVTSYPFIQFIHMFHVHARNYSQVGVILYVERVLLPSVVLLCIVHCLVNRRQRASATHKIGNNTSQHKNPPGLIEAANGVFSVTLPYQASDVTCKSYLLS